MLLIRTKCTVLALLLCVGAVSAAGAQTPEQRAMAAVNMIDHTIECVTYYKIIAQCIRNRDQKDELAVGYDRAADQLLELGFQLSQTVGLKPEAFAAKIKYISQRHKDRMGSDCINISVLFEYTDRCKRLVEAPDAILKENLRREQQRVGGQK